MTQTPLMTHAHRALGHSQQELDRLIEQTRFFGDLTHHVLQLAGIAPGMHVLDVGCGTGGTTFLVARLVGPTGSVTGVDKAPEAIALATEQATSAGLANVHLVTADLATYEADALFDALVGTRILMYFADPAVLLRRLVRFVRPGGVILFQELDIEGAKSEPPSPLYERSFERVRQTFIRAGADIRAGLRLAQIFEDAGLPSPQMIHGARVEKGPNAEIYSQLAQVSRLLLPLMELTGVATAAEVEVETLVAPPMIGAWTRKDG